MTSQTAESPEDRLDALGLRLPPVTRPAANYIPWQRVGDVVYVAGQVPFVDGRLPVTGKVGEQVNLDVAREQAQVAALNALSIGVEAAGTLDMLSVAHLMVFVASSPTFVEQHLVADGASNLLATVLADAGKHPRTAIATPCLPLDASVEVQVVFSVGNHR